MGPIFVVLMLHHFKKNHNFHDTLLKFIYSEKATKFCEIFILLLTVCTVVKSKVKISQNIWSLMLSSLCWPTGYYSRIHVSWVSKLLRLELVLLLSLKDLQNCKNCNLPAVCRLYFPNNRVADKAYCKLLPLFFIGHQKHMVE